jgi:hypothetical protein
LTFTLFVPVGAATLDLNQAAQKKFAKKIAGLSRGATL